MNIQEENIRIAKWLGWEIDDWDMLKFNKFINIPIFTNKLKFHLDFNWQMLCLQKIMKDNKLKSLKQVFSLLEDIQSEIHNEGVDISTELDIFNSIVSYTYIR